MTLKELRCIDVCMYEHWCLIQNHMYTMFVCIYDVWKDITLASADVCMIVLMDTIQCVLQPAIDVRRKLGFRGHGSKSTIHGYPVFFATKIHGNPLWINHPSIRQHPDYSWSHGFKPSGLDVLFLFCAVLEIPSITSPCLPRSCNTCYKRRHWTRLADFIFLSALIQFNFWKEGHTHTHKLCRKRSQTSWVQNWENVVSLTDICIYDWLCFWRLWESRAMFENKWKSLWKGKSNSKL